MFVLGLNALNPAVYIKKKKNKINLCFCISCVLALHTSTPGSVSPLKL
uniref:Uncharacterized protein n=1 Tax=Anguilla anguilla TaxID=7936 RepID=A0A0E9QX30_ANGAN